MRAERLGSARLGPARPGMLGRIPDSCWDELGMALGHSAGTEWVNGPGRNLLGRDHLLEGPGRYTVGIPKKLGPR